MTGRDVKNDDARFWHIADNPTAPAFVRFWTIADKGRFLARGGLSAFDPKRTFGEQFTQEIIACALYNFACLAPHLNESQGRWA